MAFCAGWICWVEEAEEQHHQMDSRAIMLFAKFNPCSLYSQKLANLTRITDAYTEQPKYVYNSYCVGTVQFVLIAARTSLLFVLACPSSKVMLCIRFRIRLCISACVFNQSVSGILSLLSMSVCVSIINFDFCCGFAPPQISHQHGKAVCSGKS